MRRGQYRGPRKTSAPRQWRVRVSRSGHRTRNGSNLRLRRPASGACAEHGPCNPHSPCNRHHRCDRHHRSNRLGAINLVGRRSHRLRLRHNHGVKLSNRTTHVQVRRGPLKLYRLPAPSSRDGNQHPSRGPSPDRSLRRGRQNPARHVRSGNRSRVNRRKSSRSTRKNPRRIISADCEVVEGSFAADWARLQ